MVARSAQGVSSEDLSTLRERVTSIFSLLKPTEAGYVQVSSLMQVFQRVAPLVDWERLFLCFAEIECSAVLDMLSLASPDDDMYLKTNAAGCYPNAKRNAVLQHLGKLSSGLQDEAVSAMEKLASVQDAQEGYGKLVAEDSEAIDLIFATCASPDNDSETSLNCREFKTLHSAVSKVLNLSEIQPTIRANSRSSMRRSGATKNLAARESFSLQHAEEFEKACLTGSSTVDKQRVAHWLLRLAPGQQTNMPLLPEIANRCKAIVEVDKFSKVSELNRTLGQYGDAFVKLQQTSYHPISSRSPPDSPLQPAADAGPGTQTTADDILNQGLAVIHQVEAMGEEMCLAIGAPFWSMGPLKSRRRSIDKVTRDYNGDARRLLDVVRYSVVCENLAMIDNAIKFVESRKDVEIVRIKSGFDPDMKHAAKTGGYRDVKLNCKHLSNGHIFEIQLHLLIFYSIKHEGGHELYQWSRQFSVQGISSAVEVLGALSPDLIREMKDVATLRLAHVIRKRGFDSFQALHWRLIVAEIAILLRDVGTFADVVNVMLNQVKTESLKAASRRDLILIHVVAGTYDFLDKDHALDVLTTASKLYESIPDGEKQTSDHLLSARCNDGIASWNWGHEEGASRFELAMNTYKDILGERHPKTLAAMKNVGANCIQLGKLQEGLDFLCQVESLHEGGSAKSAKSTLFLSEVYIEIADAKEHLGLPTEAITYYKRSVEIRKKELGDRHIRTAYVLLALAKCQKSVSNVAECKLNLGIAREIFEDRVATQISHVGPQALKRENTCIEEIKTMLETLN